MNTSTNPVTVVKNGVEVRLDSLARSIRTKGGIASMAPTRGASASVLGRTGSLYRPGKKRDEGRSILSMWAQDTDEDGIPAADPYLQWRSNMDELLRLFDTSLKQIELREYVQKVPLGASLDGKPYRRAMIEVRSAIDPEVLGRVFGQFNVECIINGTYWEDPTVTTWNSPLGAGAVATHNVVDLAGLTAPIEDATITLFGATATNPKLVDPYTGHYVLLKQPIPAAGSWVINCSTWESTLNGANVTANTESSGPFSPRLFGISPENGTPRVQLVAVGTDATTGVRIEARRKFH